jgi:hypothetical protein
VNEGFWFTVFRRENTCQAPLAATESPFSTYFIGACIESSGLVRDGANRQFRDFTEVFSHFFALSASGRGARRTGSGPR